MWRLFQAPPKTPALERWTPDHASMLGATAKRSGIYFFLAEHCPWSKALMIQSLQKQYPTLKICTIDVWSAQGGDMPSQIKFRCVPAIFAFHHGQIEEADIGMPGKLQTFCQQLQALPPTTSLKTLPYVVSNNSVSWPMADACPALETKHGSDTYSARTLAFIKTMKARKIPLAVQIASLHLNNEEQELEPFCDTLTFDYPNIPVRLYDNIYDLSSIEKLKCTPKGRLDPVSQQPFQLLEVQAGFDIVNKLDAFVAKYAKK